MRLRYLLTILAIVIVVVAFFKSSELAEPASDVLIQAAVLIAWVLALVAAAPSRKHSRGPSAIRRRRSQRLAPKAR